MGQNKILTLQQSTFIKAVGKEKEISGNFYLSGGTALAAYYIPYRFSDDLNFFSEKEFEVGEIAAFLKKYKKEIGYDKFDYQKSFNRNLYFLFIRGDILKVEFTYYPFPQIEKPKKADGIKIDSALDIAVNKLFTIVQTPRTRDFMDLYFIVKKYGFDFFEIQKKAKIKFDWHIDPVNLGVQLLRAGEISDYPKLIEKINDLDWRNFYFKIAKKLKKNILI